MDLTFFGVTTFAGDVDGFPGDMVGDRMAARFDGLKGVCRRPNGNLLLCDRNNNK